MFQRGPSSGV